MPIQPYSTYQPWQGQYTTQFPTYQAPQMVQPYQQPVNGVIKVDGPNEAMNRLLMQHANQLVPGFVSEPQGNSYGYMPSDTGMGYDSSRNGYGMQQPVRSGYRDSMGRYATRPRARRSYSGGMYGHTESIDGIIEEYEAATPEEKDEMKRRLRPILGI